MRKIERTEIVDCPTCGRPGHERRKSREILTEVDEDAAQWGGYGILTEPLPEGAPEGSIRAAALAGSEISASAREGVEVANAEGRPVAFAFSGVLVVCRPGDDPREIVRKWWARDAR